MGRLTPPPFWELFPPTANFPSSDASDRTIASISSNRAIAARFRLAPRQSKKDNPPRVMTIELWNFVRITLLIVLLVPCFGRVGSHVSAGAGVAPFPVRGTATQVLTGDPRCG